VNRTRIGEGYTPSSNITSRDDGAAMILAIDVGNTNIVIGLLDPTTDRPVKSWRLSSNRERTSDEWRGLLDPLLSDSLASSPVVGSIIDSVVPAITMPISTLCAEWIGRAPIVVSPALDLGFELAMERPSEVGADRLANAAAARQLIDGPCVILDLGTATKVEAIDRQGVFRGGIIAPGIGLSRDALATRAARLFAVELTAPAEAIGINTSGAVQSGIVRGHARMIEGLVVDVWAELGEETPVLLTGGFASTIHEILRLPVIAEPDLTLIGLGYLYHRNATN
jgi:type III pantothenate kinase